MVGGEFHNGSTATITIGDNVMIAPNVHMYCTTHVIGETQRRTKDICYDNITVEEGCWICADVIILPGVSVKRGCIIAAGAVVNRDTEPNGLYAGIPAKRIRELN